MGKTNRSAIVTLVERTSRFLIAFALRPGIAQRICGTSSSEPSRFCRQACVGR